MYRYERKRHEKQTNLEQQHHSTKSDINHDMRYPALSHEFDSRLLSYVYQKIAIKLVGNRVHWPRHQSSPGCDQDRTDLGCQGLDQPFYSGVVLFRIQQKITGFRMVSFPDLFHQSFFMQAYFSIFMPSTSIMIISTVFLAGKTFNQSQSSPRLDVSSTAGISVYKT